MQEAFTTPERWRGAQVALRFRGGQKTHRVVAALKEVNEWGVVLDEGAGIEGLYPWQSIVSIKTGEQEKGRGPRGSSAAFYRG